nr:hypothetical protein [Tanacetum cinerariifolium]
QNSAKKQKTSEEVPEETLKEMMELILVKEVYKLQVENYSQMANDLILKIYKIANRPRQEDD